MSPLTWAACCTDPGFRPAPCCPIPVTVQHLGRICMTNTIAAWLAALVVAVFLADLIWFGWDLHIALGREMLRLLDWVAFWR